MTQGEISAPRFRLRAGGYVPGVVRNYLRRIADLRDKGFAPGLYTPPSEFSREWPIPGYDPRAVDQFLVELADEAAAASLRVLPGDPDGSAGDGTPRPRRLSAAWRLVRLKDHTARVPGHSRSAGSECLSG